MPPASKRACAGGSRRNVATCWRGAVAAAPPHEWDDGEWDDGQWGEWDEPDDGEWALEAQPAPLLLLTRSSSC